MLADISALLAVVPGDAANESYRQAIQDDNVLGKKTASTRLWAWKKLRELYALDLGVPIFRLFRFYWDVDSKGRPLLALLTALARDSLLRASVAVIGSSKAGDVVSREQFERAIIAERGERFSRSTMDAILSHLLSSWTESGHLTGRKEKVRTSVVSTVAATTYALALGYLGGARGERLFETLWTSVLDAPQATLHEQAREASRIGWLTYRGVGRIVEITFPGIVTKAELEV